LEDAVDRHDRDLGMDRNITRRERSSMAKTSRATWVGAGFGQISIGNSDAGASSHTDQAIDEGYRAVGEQLVMRSRNKTHATRSTQA
jgi:hypothetical protein